MPIKMPANNHAHPGGQLAETYSERGSRLFRILINYITSGAETPMIVKPLRSTCWQAAIKLKRA